MINTKEVIKIALLNDWYAPAIAGGVEVSVQETAFALQKESFQVSVFTLHQPQYRGIHIIDGIEVNFVAGLNFRKKYISNGVIHVLEKIRTTIDLITPLLTLRKIKKFSPNFIVIHEIDRYGPWLLIFSRLFFNKSQLVRVHHDLSDTCVLRSRKLFDDNCINLCTLCTPKSKIYSLLSNLVNRNIGNSKFVAKDLKSRGFNIEINNVGNPVAADISQSVIYPEKKLTHSLGYVGRITKLKGVETILRAAALARPIWQVHLIGPVDPSYKYQLEILGQELKIEVNFHPSTDDPYKRLYPIVDCIVVASEYLEPFGKIPIEATLKRIPVISTDIAGLEEVLESIEPHPKVFIAGNPFSLAEQLNDFFRPKNGAVKLSSKNILSNVLIEMFES